ncbi:putative acetyltransferase [compost metagenome]
MVMQIRKLTVADSAPYKAIRLQALEQYPEAFGSSYEDEKEKSLEDIARMLGAKRHDTDFIVGAFDHGNLVGTVGFFQQTKTKIRHKGLIWGVYVLPEAQGRGIAYQLMDYAISEAGTIHGLEQIHLSVTASNTAAVRLYDKLNFTVYGFEKNAIKFGDRYVDEEHRVLDLVGSL